MKNVIFYNEVVNFEQKPYLHGRNGLCSGLSSVRKGVEGTLRQLEKMTELNETPETLLNKLHHLRRPLIQPATLTASQYAVAWSSQKYKGKAFQPDAKGLYTSSGKITVYPDFLCLNLRTRQEFIWEHFGLMDDPKYAANFVRKLHIYADNGIIAGHNLIITTESSKEQLNPKHVEELIKLYLK